MRPVERGTAPKSYANYGDAIGDLESRLGVYCSYCESRVSIGLAVEHKVPKKPHPELELEWTNFLLGCMTCNSIKGDKVKTKPEALWPDLNNTILALEYFEGGFVDVGKGLNGELKNRARALIDLVGLDRHKADGWPQPTGRDKRSSDRELIWKTATDCRSRFQRLGESEDALTVVLQAAKGLGFFSVWLSVFMEYSQVRKALIAAIPGTAIDCFDCQGNPIPRPGAEI